MQAIERLLGIEGSFGKRVRKIVPLELDGETLRLILYLKDGTNLRVVEQWKGRNLKRYSYYWLSETNQLKIGWDNAPHHTRLRSHPHHKHIGNQKNIVPSSETSLEAFLSVVLGDI